MKRLWLAAIVTAVAVSAACELSRPALNLDGNRLTIFNDSDEEWRDVEVILNHHFRIQPKNIEPDGVVQAPLDIFVAAMGSASTSRRCRITDLVLKAKRPNGEPFEVRYEFRKGGLDDALGGFKGKS